MAENDRHDDVALDRVLPVWQLIRHGTSIYMVAALASGLINISPYSK